MDKIIMLVVTLQILEAIGGAAFLYQSSVSLYVSIRELRAGQNGLTLGLAVLLTALFLRGLIASVEGFIGAVQIISPLGIPAISLYTVGILLARSIDIYIAIIGMHLIRNKLYKENYDNDSGPTQETSSK